MNPLGFLRQKFAHFSPTVVVETRGGEGGGALDGREEGREAFEGFFRHRQRHFMYVDASRPDSRACGMDAA